MTRPMYAMLSPGRCCLIWLLFVFLHDCGVGLPSRLSFCLWLVCCWGWRWNSGLRLDLLDNYYFSPMGIVEGMALCIAGAGDAAAAGPQGPGAGTVPGTRMVRTDPGTAFAGTFTATRTPPGAWTWKVDPATQPSGTVTKIVEAGWTWMAWTDAIWISCTWPTAPGVGATVPRAACCCRPPLRARSHSPF